MFVLKRLITLVMVIAMLFTLYVPAMGATAGNTVIDLVLEGKTNVALGEGFDVKVRFNDLSEKIMGIRLVIGFDSSKLSLESITCKSPFKDWMATPQDEKVVDNKVVFEKFTLSEIDAANKDFAVLHFKAKQAGDNVQVCFEDDGEGVSLTSMAEPNGMTFNASELGTGVSINIISESANRDSNHGSHQEKQEPKDKNEEQPQPETLPASQLRDTKGHWAEGNINKLVASSALSGYPDGTFKPDARIKRAEFATILVKAFKLEAKTGKVFADTANHWAKDAIATAAAYGIVGGYDDTTFGPEDDITREQMALMIVRAAKLDDAAGSKEFADGTAISGWAANAVNTAFENGIISGYPDNTFKPQGNAKRAEAVTVIVNALK